MSQPAVFFRFEPFLGLTLYLIERPFNAFANREDPDVRAA